MRKTAAALALILSAGMASAIGENLFQGVYDFLISLMLLRVKDTIAIVAANLAAKPDLIRWPLLTSLHDSFTWLGGFFTLAMTYHGVKYIMAADSPGGRAKSKADLQRLVAGMVIVTFNGLIYGVGLDLSSGMTDAFIGSIGVSDNALSKVLMLSTVSFACLIAPLGFLVAVLLLVMSLGRYLLLVLLWAFFPLILAFYFSQLGILQKIGARGINLYVAALLSGPVMGFIFKVSYELLIAATDGLMSTQQLRINGFEPLVALLMSLVGFILAGLSPLAMFGLIEKMGSVAAVVGSVAGAAAGGGVGAAVGGAAGAALKGLTMPAEGKGQVGYADQGVKNKLEDAGRNASENMRNNAVKVAATKDHDATTREGKLRFMKDVHSDDELIRQYKTLLNNGTVKEDDKGRIQVGDGGRYIAKNTNLMEGRLEFEVPHGRGFGDEKSRALAEEQGLVSDGKVVLKNATYTTVTAGGQKYTVAASEGKCGTYDVAVNGDKMMVANIPKTGGFDTRQEVIQRIVQEAEESGESPGNVVREIVKQYETKKNNRKGG